MTNKELENYIRDNFQRILNTFINKKEGQADAANINQIIDMADDLLFIKYIKGKSVWISGVAVAEEIGKTEDIPY